MIFFSSPKKRLPVLAFVCDLVALVSGKDIRLCLREHPVSSVLINTLMGFSQRQLDRGGEGASTYSKRSVSLDIKRPSGH